MTAPTSLGLLYLFVQDLASALIGPFDSYAAIEAHLQACQDLGGHSEVQAILPDGHLLQTMLQDEESGFDLLLTPEEDLAVMKEMQP